MIYLFFKIIELIPLLVIETKEGNVTTIEAFIKPHPREHLMLKNDTKACCMCAAGVDVKHTVSNCTWLHFIEKQVEE